MTNETRPERTRRAFWPARQVWLVAALCFIVGLPAGYLLGSSSPPAAATRAGNSPASAPGSIAHGPVTLQEMQQMADRQAAPLLQQLRTDPRNLALLTQVAAIYHVSHRFGEAADYYRRALEIDPGNVALRTKHAASMYRDGNVDGAIAELNRALQDDPKNPDALFNLGVMESVGKGDMNRAVAAWQRLLQSNPQLRPDRKATVLALIAQASMAMKDQQEGAGKHAIR